MKEFDWSEVVEYLNDNLDKEFNYGNSWSEKWPDGECNCLMSSFFDFKDVLFKCTSYCGLEAIKDGEEVAVVRNSPVSIIGEIHTDTLRSLKFGRDIKNRLDEITKQQ